MTLSRVRAVNLTAVLGLKSRHAGDRDGNIRRTASDTATGHRFGDFPADGGMSFDQRSGDANGADLVGLGVNDETPVKEIRRTRRIRGARPAVGLCGRRLAEARLSIATDDNRDVEALKRAEKLGATATVLDIDWNSLLKPPGDGLKKLGGHELVLEALKSSNETLVVGVMASLKGAAAEYALTRDAQGKVSATRPGARVIIPFSEKDRITAVRKSVEKKQQGWTWRG